MCSGAQGKELLSALGRFVTDIIALDEDDTVEDMAKLVILRGRPGRHVHQRYISVYAYMILHKIVK